MKYTGVVRGVKARTPFKLQSAGFDRKSDAQAWVALSVEAKVEACAAIHEAAVLPEQSMSKKAKKKTTAKRKAPALGRDPRTGAPVTPQVRVRIRKSGDG